MSNRITVIGTIATPPRMIGNEPAKSLCTFRLASNDRRYDREKGEWVDGTTNWFTVNVFRGLGEHAGESFSTGDRVLITGRLRVRQWESKERSGTSTEIDAEALGHDLRWGVSRFEKRGGAVRPVDAEQAAAAHPAGGASGFTDPNAGESGFARVGGDEARAADASASETVDAGPTAMAA